MRRNAQRGSGKLAFETRLGRVASSRESRCGKSNSAGDESYQRGGQASEQALTISSQRPANLSPTIVSHLHNFFIQGTSMFFHIDESGNTGNGLFDAAQPVLSYGLLSSCTNVDALGVELHRAMLAKLGVEALHAADLGSRRIETIAPILIQLQNKMNFSFDYYFMHKPTYALVQFFEAVYDAGLNEAVAWMHYWTPMRFFLIGALGELMDEALLRRSWSLSTERRISARLDEVVALLREVRERVSSSDLDARGKEIFINPLNFGIAHPSRLDFGTSDPKIISPNAVAFQFVINAMGRHLRKKGAKTALAVTLDHQQQFNAAQLKTHEAQRLIAEGFKKSPADQQAFILNHPLYQHLNRDEVIGRRVPVESPHVKRSAQSIGLQVVDVYLWLTNKVLQGVDLPPASGALAHRFLKRASLDGISMEGMQRRWRAFEEQLPGFEDLTEDQLREACEVRDIHRGKVASLGI